jgi:RNA polymerase sporulation-specific sigma factor
MPVDPGEHLGLVRHVARRFAAAGLDAEELFQVGCVGLVKAAARFDPSLGAAFSTYAVPVILGEIQRHLRDQGPLAMGREAKRLARRAMEEQAALRQRLGREPTVGEVAAAVGAEPQELAAALEGIRPPAPLDEAQAAPGADLWDRVELRLLLSRLPERQRRVIALRFFAGRTQAEVGRALGISQAQVSRLEGRALKALREAGR